MQVNNLEIEVYPPYWNTIQDPVQHLIDILNDNFDLQLVVSDASYDKATSIFSFSVVSLNNFAHIDKKVDGVQELTAFRYYLSQHVSKTESAEKEMVNFMNANNDSYEKWDSKLILAMLEVLIDISVSVKMGVRMGV